MRIAVLADIHGNMPALEAVLANLQPLQVDGMIVAGDMVTGPNSVEVLNRLQDLRAWMIRGNNENYLVRFENGDAPDWWYTARQWAVMRWVYQQMDSMSLDLIKSLPDERVIAFPGKDAIRVVHGSLDDPSEHLFPEQGHEALDRTLARINEPVLACGHSHIPWQEMRDGCLAFNPGAVCGPLNGYKGTQYALLNWKGDGWELEFRQLEYDFSLVRKEFEDTGMLKEGGAFARAYLQDVLSGTNHTAKFLDHAYRQAAQAGFPDCEYVPDEIWDRAVETYGWEEQ